MQCWIQTWNRQSASNCCIFPTRIKLSWKYGVTWNNKTLAWLLRRHTQGILWWQVFKPCYLQVCVLCSAASEWSWPDSGKASDGNCMFSHILQPCSMCWGHSDIGFQEYLYRFLQSIYCQCQRNLYKYSRKPIRISNVYTL